MILVTIARLVMPVFLIFSLFLLLRGHDAPGGGFTGGLVASAGIVLYGLANGPAEMRRALWFDLEPVVGVGLLTALGSSLVGIFFGKPFFASVWHTFPNGYKLGTPFVFDIGVYLVVVGVVLRIMTSGGEPETEVR